MTNNIFEPSEETDAEIVTEEPLIAPFRPEPFQAPGPDETIRRSGLAWSAGIVFFSSIAFMLLLGWIADWVLGSRPWGLVGGIVLGSIIGFIQFFRLSSQIYSTQKTEAEMHPLLGPRDEEK